MQKALALILLLTGCSGYVSTTDAAIDAASETVDYCINSAPNVSGVVATGRRGEIIVSQPIDCTFASTRFNCFHHVGNTSDFSATIGDVNARIDTEQTASVSNVNIIDLVNIGGYAASSCSGSIVVQKLTSCGINCDIWRFVGTVCCSNTSVQVMFSSNVNY